MMKKSIIFLSFFILVPLSAKDLFLECDVKREDSDHEYKTKISLYMDRARADVEEASTYVDVKAVIAPTSVKINLPNDLLNISYEISRKDLSMKATRYGVVYGTVIDYKESGQCKIIEKEETLF